MSNENTASNLTDVSARESETPEERADRIAAEQKALEKAQCKAYVDAFEAAEAAEREALRDLETVRAMGAKKGKRAARAAFLARVEAYRGTKS